MVGTYFTIFYLLSGKLILVQHIQLHIISTMPPQFELKCITRGGPLATSYWTRNGKKIINDATFSASLVVVDYINATYDHTVTVFGNIPGTYVFFAVDPFLLTGPIALSTKSIDKNGTTL